MKTASIIIIGNEILSGRTKDTNSNYLAKILVEKGITLREVRVIPDNHNIITVSYTHLTLPTTPYV